MHLDVSKECSTRHSYKVYITETNLDAKSYHTLWILHKKRRLDVHLLVCLDPPFDPVPSSPRMEPRQTQSLLSLKSRWSPPGDSTQYFDRRVLNRGRHQVGPCWTLVCRWGKAVECCSVVSPAVPKVKRETKKKGRMFIKEETNKACLSWTEKNRYDSLYLL